MRIGKITSVTNTVQRNVEVRISPDEVYSEISDPPGAIAGPDVIGYDIIEQLTEGRLLVHLDLQTAEEGPVRFYTGESRFDIALLLDELVASLGDLPRRWTKTEQD